MINRRDARVLGPQRRHLNRCRDTADRYVGDAGEVHVCDLLESLRWAHSLLPILCL